MPLLVHIAPEPEAGKIRRYGIAPRRWPPDPVRHPQYDRVVWAFPVLESFTLTHQWMRELKRWGRTTLVAVAFRIPDDQAVFARHYLDLPHFMTAAEAVGIIRAAPDHRGYEVMVPRRIAAGEIVRIRILPRAIGWRYYPAAKNSDRRPCDCPMCLPRAEVKAKRYRDRIAELQARYDARAPRR